MRSAAPQSITTATPGSDLSDPVLVAHAQHDRRAFEPLYHRYFDAVFRFCFYRLGDWQDAEDATGDVFAKVIANLDRFREDGRDDAFRCWLFTVARNLSRTGGEIRPGARLPRSMAPNRSSTTRRARKRSAMADADHRLVLALLAQLNPDQRDLLQLRLVGLNDKEIASVLNRVTARSARNNRARSRPCADSWPRTRNGRLPCLTGMMTS